MTEPPAHVAGQLGLVPDDLSPAALADARTAARAELERLELAVVQQRAEALERARQHSAHVRTQTAELDAAVAEARAAGATWQQVADAVGITRQSAWARWSDGAE